VLFWTCILFVAGIADQSPSSRLPAWSSDGALPCCGCTGECGVVQRDVTRTMQELHVNRSRSSRVTAIRVASNLLVDSEALLKVGEVVGRALLCL
jgi:hypothetical protein